MFLPGAHEPPKAAKEHATKLQSTLHIFNSFWIFSDTILNNEAKYFPYTVVISN